MLAVWDKADYSGYNACSIMQVQFFLSSDLYLLTCNKILNKMGESRSIKGLNGKIVQLYYYRVIFDKSAEQSAKWGTRAEGVYQKLLYSYILIKN